MSESKQNRTIEVLQHQISYYYDIDQEMPEIDQEHVRYMITQGYCEGGLGDDDGGCWSIVKVDAIIAQRDELLIACKFYMEQLYKPHADFLRARNMIQAAIAKTENNS